MLRAGVATALLSWFREGKADQKQDKVSCEDAEDVEGRKELEEYFVEKVPDPTLGMIQKNGCLVLKEENFHVFAILNMPSVVFSHGTYDV